ncbi:hypothetical protein [Aquipuribacter sp. SD81]|uniref:hypothetical protein n=1 Tax=Aquipuribacter sp. SD81 TaxID=3127703 RepID=UPI0030194805
MTPGGEDRLRLPDVEPTEEPEEGGRHLDRRHVLAAGAAALVVGGGAVALLARPGAEGPAAAPTPSGPAQALPSNVSDPSGPDATAELQALLDSGDAEVVVPAGTHVISGTLVVPWTVSRLTLPAGAVLHMVGDEIALRRSGEVEERVRAVGRADRGDDTVELDTEGLAVGDWVYLCSDDWVKVGKSKMGMLRRVEEVGDGTVVVDKPLVRTLVDAPRAHRVGLAPALTLDGAGAVENADPVATYSNLVRLDFVLDPVVRGIELRDCGAAALRTFGTVGGEVDCYIHDCVDDQENDHYGYGVSCTSASRDLRVTGTIERVRHAFTTDHGYGAPLPTMQQTGEPEDIYVAPVVRDTTSTGIDTHEPGHGITIVPDVTGCGTMKWGGVNIRANDVVVRGGAVLDSNEWGILVQESASGTVLEDVEIRGVGGRGIHCKSDTTIRGVRLTDFGESYGIEIIEGVAVDMADTTVDGGGELGARAIVLAGTGSTLRGTVVGCGIGVLRLPTESGNDVDLEFQDVAREDVTPT